MFFFFFFFLKIFVVKKLRFQFISERCARTRSGTLPSHPARMRSTSTVTDARRWNLYCLGRSNRSCASTRASQPHPLSVRSRYYYRPSFKFTTIIKKK
jgi:hypothetical protein